MHKLSNQEEIGGWRDYLDGQPVHAGELIDICIGGHWIGGRYERAERGKVGYIVIPEDRPGDEFDVTSLLISRNTMRFRWPPRR